jgi:hypothetical protein
MSGRPALSSDATSPRVLVYDRHDGHDGGTTHEVFEVLAVSATVLRVRSPFLFEVGEQLRVRIEHEGAASEVTARVRAHLGPPEAPVSELEIELEIDPAAPPDTTASE